MPLLTIFTAPKPFKDPLITTIQRNTFQACMNLGPEVEFVVVGYEEGIEETAREFGAKFFSNVRTTTEGTPLVSSIFELARSVNSSPLLSIINADDLILPDYIEAGRKALERSKKFLLCGQKWDCDIPEPLDFSTGWEERIANRLKTTGKLSGSSGSDYFMFPRECFVDMPDFAIGRSGWDNWMLYKARREHWNLVEISYAATIGHQNHHYNHLPGGKPPYRLPETQENIRLAGGRRSMFLLHDVNYIMQPDHSYKKPKLNWKRFWREFEISPLITVKSRFLAQITFAICHPYKAYAEFRMWLRNKIKAQPK